MTMTHEEELKELRALVQEGKTVIGAERVLKELIKGKMAKIFLASNCPPKVREDVTHNAALANTIIFPLSQNGIELGVWCRKNFMISVVGIRRE